MAAPSVSDVRLLHTSDWHLGRSFHREGMLDAQATFIDFLVGVVRAEHIDVVLVAGDIYDRALPPVDAVRLCSQALRRLVDAGARVVLLSGNHDSSSRLGFGAELFDAVGLHVRTDPQAVADPVVVTDRSGQDVAIYPLPYLEPDAVGPLLGCSERGHAAVLAEALRRVRADLASRPSGTRSVLAAHAFVSGAEGSDSERDISVGGASVVPASLFDGLDYVALGHLHGAQAVRRSVLYSGSPLAYSFSEQHHAKSVTIVDLEPGARARWTRIPCPVPRPLATVRGRLSDLLTDAVHDAVRDSYLQVVLTDAERPREPMERLRTRFGHVLVLRMEPAGGLVGPSRSYAERVSGLGDLDIATGFVAHVRGSAATPAEAQLLRSAFETSRRAGQDETPAGSARHDRCGSVV